MQTLKFPTLFAALNHNRAPFPWQQRLYGSFLAGDFPSLIDLPTGAGKTSVISIWLLALAARAASSTPGPFPRRLFWVVDRRVVVDQVQSEASRLIKAATAHPELAPLFAKLSPTAGQPGEPLIACTTLRGEHADNREWSNDISRPAIVAGTVDMIGSRLLFSGYGSSWKLRPLHAALTGQDALIVNDESHLTPSFATLVTQVQRESGSHFPLRFIQLTATPSTATSDRFPASLDDDLATPAFAQRFHAVKTLELREVPDPIKEITALAKESTGPTAVFVRSPKTAKKIAESLPPQSVVVITGQMRGHEREQILDNEILRRLATPGNNDPSPCWVVATSAAEVGMDFSVSCLITDLDNAPHLIQRFGRLNRLGDTPGHAIVVGSAKDRQTYTLLENTWNYLRSLAGNISPERLRALPAPPDTSGKPPHCPPLLPTQVDAWAMTALRQTEWRDRPPVDPWLHGATENLIPETEVVWRLDVPDLTHSAIPLADVEEVLEWFPIRNAERLKQNTRELIKALEPFDRISAILQLADGELLVNTLKELRRNESDWYYATLILPPGVGALDQFGMVDWSPSAKPAKDSQMDVSAIENRRLRTAPADRPPPGFTRRFTLKVANDESPDEPQIYWHYWTAPPESQPKQNAEELTPHLKLAAAFAQQLAARLNLGHVSPRLPEILAWSAARHDLGKSRPRWQRACGDRQSVDLAKSAKFNGRSLEGFRHELASLLDAAPQLPADWSLDEQDLALHLIAAHHGYARPHFRDEAADPNHVRRSRAVATETAQRFARLHRRWGPWTLAYLESLLRTADALASRGLEENTPQ